MQQVPYGSNQGQFVPAQAQATPPPINQQAQQGEFFNSYGNAPANQDDDNMPF